jgi:hypothetical protein
MRRCLFAVGTGLNGQLGLGAAVKMSAEPVLVREGVRLAAASADASFAVFDECERTLHATASLSTTFAPLLKLDRAVAQVACGKRHTLVRDVDGALFAFGANDSGQLGVGSPAEDVTESAPPVRSRVGSDSAAVVAVAAGLLHSLAVTSDGRLYSCGASAFNELGHGTPLHESTWKRVDALAGVRVVGAAAGGLHSVAWTDDGRLFSFGRNDRGQLGTAERTFGHVAAVDVPGRVVSAACGQAHTLILCADNRLFACGDNQMGQLGHAARALGKDVLPIATPAGAAPISSISCGAFFNLACLQDGQLLAWGCGNDLQLGTGSRASVFVPAAMQCKHEQWKRVLQAAGGWGHSLMVVN